MVTFTSERVTDHITRIADGTDVCEYLVEGADRALLIDTGYGLGDLRGYVESLTSKPFDVVCTHGHVDHASGAAQFDRVFMHPADVEVHQRHADLAYRREFLAQSFAGTPEGVQDDDFVPPRIAPFDPLLPGQVFDLGGVTLEAIHVPGHTRGMMVLLDREERIAFFGDACGVHTMVLFEESSTVEEYHASLLALKVRADEFDRVLRQHGACESPASVLDENIALCELILAGKDDAQPYRFMGVDACWAKAVDPVSQCRVDGGEGNLAYRPDHIR